MYIIPLSMQVLDLSNLLIIRADWLKITLFGSFGDIKFSFYLPITKIKGINISIVFNSSNNLYSYLLLKEFGMPFSK